MPILNYTTSIDAAKTVMEIQTMLVRAKASAILTEYGTEGEIVSLNFRIDTAYGIVSFRLPARTDGVLKALQKNPKVPRALRTRKQAANVSWRIVKDWTAAQLAMVEAEIASMAEVFLPYAQDASGRTMYQALEQGGFKALALLEGPK